MRFRTRAGASWPECAWCSTSSLRSAASISPGEVSCADQTSSLTGGIPLDASPLVAVDEDAIRLLGSLRAARVLRQLLVVVAVPGLEDRVDDLPLRLDLVV